MGLLDDAIREHLDLKRRRGGDPVEIERAELDALGPVRRGPEGAEEAPAAPSAEADQELEYEHETEPEWDERYGEENGPFAAPDTADHAAAPEHADPREQADPLEHGEPFDQAEAQAPGAPVHEPPPALEPSGQETAEYDVKEHLGRAPDEDPLEETPEFLQDTPEHDRLWFEQRPPRDFDFDG